MVNLSPFILFAIVTLGPTLLAAIWDGTDMRLPLLRYDNQITALIPELTNICLINSQIKLCTRQSWCVPHTTAMLNLRIANYNFPVSGNKNAIENDNNGSLHSVVPADIKFMKSIQ